MDAYIENRRTIVKRIEAERWAAGAAARLATEGDRAEAVRTRAARGLIAVFLVVLAATAIFGGGARLEPGLVTDAGATPAAGLP